MNAKTAKALRRVARESGLSQERRRLVNSKTGQVINHPNTEHALYRAMKRYISKGGDTNAV